MKGIILFAHGARDPEWALPFERLRDRYAALHPDRPVALAFLDLMQPTLAKAMGELKRRGATEIIIAPLFMAQGNHLKRDLPALIESARNANDGIGVRVLPPLGEADEIVTAILDWLAAAAR
jgi:sirohydrochlorin cobaltochelatase